MDHPTHDDLDDTGVGIPRRFLLLPPGAAGAALGRDEDGFLSVALFASLLGVATVIHWDRFNHGHVAFWLWAGLYFAAPLLVVGAWLANRRYAAPAGVGEQRVGGTARWVAGLVGLVALGTGLAMFLAPMRMIGVWPWLLTPLTCRVVGAIFCLGSAGLGVLVDPRWVAVKLMLEVEVLMVALILVAAVRARDEFFTDRPLTGLLIGGFLAILAGSAYLWFFEQGRARLGAHRRSQRRVE